MDNYGYVPLTDEQRRTNAEKLIKEAARKAAQLGIADVDIANILLSHLAVNEGGRGGVYAWDLQDKDNELWTYVQAPAEED